MQRGHLLPAHALEARRLLSASPPQGTGGLSGGSAQPAFLCPHLSHTSLKHLPGILAPAPSFLYSNNHLIPGRSQVGPSNLAAEKRQRCLPVAKTRLYRGASLSLSPSESERARGAFPSVLWQTKAGDKGERTPGRLCHSRTTLSQIFFLTVQTGGK